MPPSTLPSGQLRSKDSPLLPAVSPHFDPFSGSLRPNSATPSPSQATTTGAQANAFLRPPGPPETTSSITRAKTTRVDSISRYSGWRMKRGHRARVALLGALLFTAEVLRGCRSEDRSVNERALASRSMHSRAKMCFDRAIMHGL